MNKPQNRSIIGFTLLTLSVAMIALGIYRNEVSTVLMKAINICLECIGLG
ncbi:thioredoxin [Clostridiaceae bacterium OttesenSCG-928-D20]|nr:thioredoxin [Clostridiaceae bacterium OttesenSCG-928-D20]